MQLNSSNRVGGKVKNDWLTAILFGVMVFVLLGCGSPANAKDASAILAEFVCPTPPGIGDFQPLLNLSPNDKDLGKLAREYIELKRRSIKESWDVAGSVFTIEQTLFTGYRNYVPEFARRAREAVRQYKEGTFPFNESLEQHLGRLKGQYDKECQARNQELVILAKLDPKLDTLRQEPSKPWLSPQKRMPCPIQRTPTCRP